MGLDAGGNGQEYNLVDGVGRAGVAVELAWDCRDNHIVGLLYAVLLQLFHKHLLQPHKLPIIPCQLMIPARLPELPGREIIHIKPVIIPLIQFRLDHLLAQPLILEFLRITPKRNIITALNNGLRLTKDPELTIKRVPHSELLWDWYYGDRLAVSDEDAWLGGTDEDRAVLAGVDVYASVRVQKEDGALLAVGDLELLHD